MPSTTGTASSSSSSKPTKKKRISSTGRTAERNRIGQFTDEESDKIKAAIHRYCNAKGVSVERLCSECEHKGELKGAWTEIAKDSIADRPIQSIYRHGLRQLHPFKRGKWSEEEVNTLVHHVGVMGKKWASIQRKMNRSADSCRDKYREIHVSYSKGRWNDDETEKLKQLIREHLKANPTADMEELGKKVASEGIKISWDSITKKMGNRSRLSCFKKWQKLSGLHSSNDDEKKRKGKKTAAKGELDDSTDVMETAAPPADPDILLLSALANSKYRSSSNVEWDEIKNVEEPEERWGDILEAFQSDPDLDEEVLALPINEIAQMILDQKTSSASATVDNALATTASV